MASWNEESDMSTKQIASLVIFTASLLTAACAWKIGANKAIGQPIQLHAEIRTTFPAQMSMATQSVAIGSNDLHLEYPGSNVVSSKSGSVLLTVTDANGNVVGSSRFPWERNGSQLVFVNPERVQKWLDQHSRAANVSAQLTARSTFVNENGRLLADFAAHHEAP
jgi:hypothetical protein